MDIIQNINPYLPANNQIIPAREGGKGNIQAPGSAPNIVWQTRSRVPDEYEVLLISALENLFASGMETLNDLIEALNQQNLFDRQGNAWTAESFREFLLVNGY
ncbi:recombinase-like helix-turn-helix domain-containing protein [uncultured Cedecea sp.]|uniref:recombinase-like helix-turn-helix domain-containing protein n=1 Tax=uncultured Cedecea sp. TaxID=988762 RepID=UPI00262E86FE|nr:recombinase-like helix-turn-helix domain-containing protein [uncultured Cedecea sp.]